MYYRLYRFKDGRVEQAVDVACEDDGDARRIAERVFDGRAAELWQGTRKVASWPPVARSLAAGAALNSAALGPTRPLDPGRLGA
jgi:hypothetical protein